MEVVLSFIKVSSDNVLKLTELLFTWNLSDLLGVPSLDVVDTLEVADTLDKLFFWCSKSKNVNC